MVIFPFHATQNAQYLSLWHHYHDLAGIASNERGRGAITAHSDHLYAWKYKSFLSLVLVIERIMSIHKCDLYGLHERSEESMPQVLTVSLQLQYRKIGAVLDRANLPEIPRRVLCKIYNICFAS